MIISNLTKTYAVYIYTCDEMTWSDEATIGFNAAGDHYENHPLSGLLTANAIDCVHDTGDESAVFTNNVVYDLVPTVANPTTPIPPPASLGECCLIALSFMLYTCNTIRSCFKTQSYNSNSLSYPPFYTTLSL